MIFEEEKLGKIYDSRILKRLLSFIERERYFIISAAILGLLLTGLQLFIPYLTRQAIDKYIINTAQIISIDEREAEKHRDILLPFEGERYLIRSQDMKKIEEKEIEEKRVYFLFDKNKAKELGIKEYKEAGNYIVVPYENLRGMKTGLLRILRGADLKGLKRVALVFLLIIIIRFFFSFAQVFLMEYSGQAIMHRLRMKIFSHLQKLPVSFFDKNPLGRLVTRNTNDVEAINQFFTEVVTALFRDFFLLFGIIIFLPILSLRLALIIFIILPPVVIITTIFRTKIRDVYRKVRVRLAKINAFLQENLTGIKVVQIFAQEEKRYNQFKEVNHKYYEANFNQILVFAVFRPIIDLLASIGLALLIWFGGGGVIAAWVSLGTLVAFISYVEYLFDPIRDIAEKFNLMQGAMASGERIFILLDQPEEKYEGKRILEKVKGKIEFKNVWFAYDKDEYVLKDISFKVRPKEKIAFVGATGAGKTSLINLLTRFYEINKGTIYLDGIDTRELDKKFLRSQIGIVMQDVFLFAGDVRENIRLRASIGDEVVENSARIVRAHEFIERLQNGYREEIRERGVNLSMGERQLLSFARALAFNPKILVLDEATSSVDTKTEALIQKGLRELLKGRTALIIAHRLSTIKGANRILVLHKGRIVEEGTHESLLRKKGYYYNLYHLQYELPASKIVDKMGHAG